MAEPDAFGPDFRAEIVRGTVVERAAPSAEHSASQVSLGGALMEAVELRVSALFGLDDE